MSHSKKLLFILFAGILGIFSASCGNEDSLSGDEIALEQTLQAISKKEETAQAAAIQPDETEAEIAEVEEAQAEIPLQMPGDPPESVRMLEDPDSSIRAYENRAITGDKFLDSLYEQPFTSKEMVYQPDLDIYSVDFSHDEDFFYFEITLIGLHPDEGRLTGMYGIEFDRTLTGRGDLIVLVQNPLEDWSTENLSVYSDENEDVGGEKPMVAETGFTGNGYDTQVELAGEKSAMARIAPDDNEAIQIAVSRALLDLEDPEVFLYGAWAQKGTIDVARFDYNDRMGPTEAGSPIITDEDYPLNALYNPQCTL
jgi:hypothetical protein